MLHVGQRGTSLVCEYESLETLHTLVQELLFQYQGMKSMQWVEVLPTLMA
jgi:hypothetical protein